MDWDCYTWEMFAAAVQVWFGGIPFREDRGGALGTRDDRTKKGLLLLASPPRGGDRLASPGGAGVGCFDSSPNGIGGGS